MVCSEVIRWYAVRLYGGMRTTLTTPETKQQQQSSHVTIMLLTATLSVPQIGTPDHNLLTATLSVPQIGTPDHNLLTATLSVTHVTIMHVTQSGWKVKQEQISLVERPSPYAQQTKG